MNEEVGTIMSNYYTEKTVYEISETIIPDEESVYVLMSGAGAGPDEQYEAGYEPLSVNDLFYNYTIYNGGIEDVYDKNAFGRCVNGISYDLNTILEMISKLQENPGYGDETKYYVVKAGRQLEEFKDISFGSTREGRLTGKCYIVILGYSEFVEKILGVFSDLESAINYGNFIYCECDWLEGEIDILEAKIDMVSTFYDTADDLAERDDVYFR